MGDLPSFVTLGRLDRAISFALETPLREPALLCPGLVSHGALSLSDSSPVFHVKHCTSYPIAGTPVVAPRSLVRPPRPERFGSRSRRRGDPGGRRGCRDRRAGTGSACTCFTRSRVHRSGVPTGRSFHDVRSEARAPMRFRRDPLRRAKCFT